MTNVTSIFTNNARTQSRPTVTIEQNELEASIVVAQAPTQEPQNNPTVYQDYSGKSQTMFNVETDILNSPKFGKLDAKKGLFVNGNNINIVSNKYAIVQPKSVLERFETVASQSNLEINKVLLNPTNGGMMISAKFGDTQILNDTHDINVVFYTSHCGKYKTFLTLDVLRMACFNQVPALYKNKDRFIFAEKHYQNALNLDLIQSAVANIPASIEAYNIKAQQLQDIKLSQSDFVAWYVDQLKLDAKQKQFDSKVSNIINTYQSGKGQSVLHDGTGWKALNTISFLNTHNVKNTASKAENVLLKGGNDTLKRMDLLLAM